LTKQHKSINIVIHSRWDNGYNLKPPGGRRTPWLEIPRIIASLCLPGRLRRTKVGKRTVPAFNLFQCTIRCITPTATKI
jgi:hypothetical protein